MTMVLPFQLEWRDPPLVNSQGHGTGGQVILRQPCWSVLYWCLPVFWVSLAGTRRTPETGGRGDVVFRQRGWT